MGRSAFVPSFEEALKVGCCAREESAVWEVCEPLNRKKNKKKQWQQLAGGENRISILCAIANLQQKKTASSGLVCSLVEGKKKTKPQEKRKGIE